MNNHLVNLILNVDSYKGSHHLQYPPNTGTVYAYIESRGGRYSEVMFFGLQAFIKEYLLRPITLEEIDEAQVFFAAHGVPFNRSGWDRIFARYGGYLPIQITAVPEGTMVPTGVPMVTVWNTDESFPWLVTYIETALLRAVWYPSTVATVSHECKKIIKTWMEKTCDDLSSLPFKLHDFGARGVSSLESASLGGMAHLVSFMGSDTISGILAASKYYDEPMAGFSIPAAEHSTITSWGRGPGEEAAYRNMIEQFGSGQLYAVVSDSYDIYHAVDELWGKALVDEVKSKPAILVVRPDSGIPHEVVTEVLHSLYKSFGGSINSKGFIVLDHVRVIQGDGICEAEIDKILLCATIAGYSAENIAFGMGGALLQRLDRDTQKFAMKASARRERGSSDWIPFNKSPITEPFKASKAGCVTAVRDHLTGKIRASVMEEPLYHNDSEESCHVTYVVNGVMLRKEAFANIRARADSQL